MIKRILFVLAFLNVYRFGIGQEEAEILKIKENYNKIQSEIDTYEKVDYIDVCLANDIRPNRYSIEGNGIVNSIITNCYKYYRNDTLKRIVMTFDSPTGFLTSEYYINNNNLFFVFKTFKKYKHSINSEEFDENDYEILENRFYFRHEKLIRWINSEKEKVNCDSEYFKKEGRNILLDFEIYYSINERDRGSLSF